MKSLLFTAALLLFVAGLDLSLRVGDTSHRLVAEPRNVATGSLVLSPVATPVRVVGPLRRAHVRRSSHPHPSLDWQALAECESSGNWHDTAGYFQGGLQFAPRTWASFHGTDYAPRADLATRWQQIVVAERVLRRQGLAAWPACTRALGWR